jgi:acyl carrier protein
MSTPTFDAIVTVLTTKFDVARERIDAAVPLQDLGLDSLSLMEFVFAIEDHFDLRIPDERLDPRQAHLTVADLCTALDEGIAQRHIVAAG